jgi:hypothetical protein
VVQAEGGPGAATLSGYVSLAEVRYLYILGVRFTAPGRVMQVRPRPRPRPCDTPPPKNKTKTGL